MKKTALLGWGVSALMLGGTMVGCGHAGDIASASSAAQTRSQKGAATAADRAARALAKDDARGAIRFAESAVAGSPQDVGYRMLLAQAYLGAGRFVSARTAFGDVLALKPDEGRAALNLALAEIATGDWQAARTTLESNAALIPVADRGLALALAGDTQGGGDLLLAAARTPGATAKVRQNLALTLALAGKWPEARAMAGVDMAPAQADARIVEWAAFAKPRGAADQVAALLGVTPVEDQGQPATLALSGAVPMGAAETEVATLDVPPPPVEVTVGDAPVMVAARDDAPVLTASAVFKTRAAATPVVPAATAKPLAKGNFYVQLGAFDNAGVARDAWGRAQKRLPAFGQLSPAGMAFRDFYRLSVGGFTRGDATRLCGAYRAKGGTCFVRAGAGDQVASWVKPKRVEMAAR